MKTLTEVLLGRGTYFNDGLVIGARSLHAKRAVAEARETWATVRMLYGLSPNGTAEILTWPRGNNKLKKASVPTYGLTLQHYVQRLKGRSITINACPNAGDCVKVCVLDNGYGTMPGIQEARRARTEFLARYPFEAGVLIGHELRLAVKREGKILFRPNVNSDVEWEKVAPSLTSGELFGEKVLSYGYTKLETVLATDGWLDKRYRVAYSWNENSDPNAVAEFLNRGGSVAIVTSRRKKEPVADFRRLDAMTSLGGLGRIHIVDADLTDEWIFQRRTIGDLSAKGRARKLIGSSGFVATIPRSET